MASITFTNLENTGKSSTGFTYSDLHLDIEETTVRVSPDGQAINGRDIRLDYDIDAIINSLVNIFNTIPGERFLVPRFGTNLRRYLFDPITDITARKIGNEIVFAIETWEPRVTLTLVNVVGKPEEHEYEVTISLVINDIKEAVNITGTIDIDDQAILRNLALDCSR